MGFSHKSHDKKTDKETQSPMLKIFRDIMQKEKHNPEKTNLLKEKNVEKKRKHYSGSRSKSGHKSLDSNSSERKVKHPYSMKPKEARKAELDNCQSQSYPFQDEKRDSWWFWGDANTDKTKAEDTCSCVSCALKKLISTDYACVACLVVLFVVSVVVAILLLYKSVPCMTNASTAKPAIPKPMNFRSEGDRSKRKINSLNSRWNLRATKSWREKYSNSYLDNFDFRDMNSFTDEQSELSRILDPDRVNDIQSQERLRDFYRKLVETDVAIRNLKNSHSEVTLNNNLEFGNQDRIKRSLNIFHRPLKLLHMKGRTTNAKITNGKVVSKVTVNMAVEKAKKKDVARNKRFDNNSVTETFLIEKDKVVIAYKPLNRIVPKCSHVPKDSKSHETQLKHPFYKNTQRLDELLDQFLDKKLPDIFSEQFETDLINKNKDVKEPKSKNEEVVIKEDNSKDKNEQDDKEDREFKEEKDFKEVKDTTIESKETLTTEGIPFAKDFFDDSDGVEKKRGGSTNSYDLLLSISTLIKPVQKRFTTSLFPERMPNGRKLMQTDLKEHESVGYEDLKEILTDEKESQDENDKESDRKKRNNQDGETFVSTMATESKYFPQGVNNPNWKGPMPLYPEELSSMMKQGPLDKTVPVNSKDTASETDDTELALTDVEYVEDYLDNTYEKLVKLAQAYSDYGVLDEKKDSDTERKGEKSQDHTLSDRKIRLTADGFKDGFKVGFRNRLRKSGFFGRSKKGYKGADVSEGIRIEMHPTTTSREDNNPMDLYKLLQKHVKIINSEEHALHGSNDIANANRYSPYVPSTNVPYTLKSIDSTNTKKLDTGNGILYNINKKRKLKSLDSNDLKQNYNRDLENDKAELKEVKAERKFKRNVNTTVIKEDLTEKVNIDDKTINKGYENDTAVNNLKTLTTSKVKDNSVTMSDFFSLLSKWFSAIDGLEITTKKMNMVPRKQSEQAAQLNPAVVSELNYPQYDSDMIDNIGHRSRMLMSVEDSNITKRADSLLKSEKDCEERNVEVSTTTEPMQAANSTQSLRKTTASINKAKTNKTRKRIAKRHAEDSNLIFWNDLYDDEYGIQVDPFENTVRQIKSIDKDDVIQKSNTWIQDKVKKLSDKVNKSWRSMKLAGDGRNSREVNSFGSQNTARRFARYADEELPYSERIDFSAMTSRMKEVCRRAIKAVEETKNVQVRQQSTKDQAATSLMQQLIRLMTDLVDFQVQERTCRKLPPDLQAFLERLTSSAKIEDQAEPQYDRPNTELSFDILNDVDRPTPAEQDLLLHQADKETDVRTDCLGTFHAVQDLIRQYEDLSDDDKSIMVGVKDYLEHQKAYLQEQLSSTKDVHVYREDSSRFRRDVMSDVAHTIGDTIDVTAHTIQNEVNNLRHVFNKYINKYRHYTNKYSKEIAHTTANIKDIAKTITRKVQKVTNCPKSNLKMPLSNGKTKETEFKEKVEKERGFKAFDNRGTRKRKVLKDSRNIKGVYYKSLDEAKKVTGKGVHRRKLNGEVFDSAEVLRIN